MLYAAGRALGHNFHIITTEISHKTLSLDLVSMDYLVFIATSVISQQLILLYLEPLIAQEPLISETVIAKPWSYSLLVHVHLLLSFGDKGLGLSPVTVKWNGLAGLVAGMLGDPGSELKNEKLMKNCLQKVSA